MLLSRQGLVLCSTGHVQRGDWGQGAYRSQATLSSTSSRRIVLLSLGLGLPLAHLAHALVVRGGDAKAVSLAEAKPLASGGVEAESAVEVFGFDGLGKASEEYVPGKIVALAQAGDGAVLFLGFVTNCPCSDTSECLFSVHKDEYLDVNINHPGLRIRKKKFWVDGFELPLQLVVGPAEAMAVLTAVQERKTRRPVTHEAWGLSLAAVGWKVDRVAITSNENDVFYSRVILSNPAETRKSIDVRPSDGIALALRCRAPLYVLRKVAQDILVAPNPEQAEKKKPDPLKRPSLQASNKSSYIDNSLALTTAENLSDPLLFMDEEVSELLGTSVKVFI
ncbi:hypothetical protein AXG93_4485s1230 [Marchantia polymorpha subsp. ruderalis]|uniref:BFN domain-containing protein n=1 Tax=Marchantia polymorpha subsp. ruderalis TaxID=1480154 RepID=A0A176WIE1_MARPO|nr:hypothetical protein AXG93_4485s1230 [Marchantia polymorpha subsp. ruderalis]